MFTSNTFRFLANNKATSYLLTELQSRDRQTATYCCTSNSAGRELAWSRLHMYSRLLRLKMMLQRHQTLHRSRISRHTATGCTGCWFLLKHTVLLLYFTLSTNTNNISHWNTKRVY